MAPARHVLALLPLLLALALPRPALASGPGSLWDLTPAPDRQQGGFWALAQRWHETDGVDLVLLRFDHEGEQVGEPVRVALGETWRTGIATAAGGELLIAWWDAASDRFLTRWGDVGGNLASAVTIEADPGHGKPSVVVDPISNEFVVVWNAQTAGWQTWTTWLSHADGSVLQPPAVVYGAWGAVEPNDARVAFGEDGSALLVTSAGSGVWSTDFGPGMDGGTAAPRQIANAGLAPGNPEVAFDKGSGQWVAAWTGWSGPAHILAAWMDSTGTVVPIELDSGPEARGAPSIAWGFESLWFAWYVQDGAQMRVDGLTATGPAGIGSIQIWVPGSPDALSTPRLGSNPVCPNLSLFLTRHLELDEPEVVALEREDPCPPGDDDDAADDDSAADDDADDDGGDDDGGGQGGRGGGCGRANAAGGPGAGPAGLLVLSGLLAAGRRRPRWGRGI